MILIVDDEKENRESLEALLKRDGWTCYLAENGEEGLKILRENKTIKILLTDLKMPGGMDGIELMEMARLIRPDVHRILLTAYGTIEDTVQAMKKGAFDVLAKPIKSKELKDKIQLLLGGTAKEAPTLATPLNHISSAYAGVLEKARKAALSQAPILITGEAGTGKTFLAKILHEWSTRSEKNYFSFHCASVSKEKLEETLFGSLENGQLKPGLLKNLDGGTLYLNEISKLTLPVQIKLYQFLKEGKFFPLGSHEAQQSNLRMIASSSENLELLVREGQFQKELYFKINIVEINVPALRKRREDLLWLVPSLLHKICEKNGLTPINVHQRCFEKFWKHGWPENIRELEKVLESALVMAPPEHIQEGFLYPEDFKLNSSEYANEETFVAPSNFPDLATIEKQIMEQALAITGGNRRLSAKLLGISERTLYRSLKDN